MKVFADESKSGEKIVYLAHNAKDTGISTKFHGSLLKDRWK